MSDPHHQSAEVPSITRGHEPTEIKIRPAILVAIGIVVLVVTVTTVLGGLMSLFKTEEKALGLSSPALYKDDAGQFPEPRLQRNTTDDMAKFLDNERAGLESYGWVDRQAGIARIPIERALELMAERGLPTADTRPKSTEPSKTP